MNNMRESKKIRKTRETSVEIYLNLDDAKESTIKTGIPFFDHMLMQFAIHGNFYTSISATGDLEVDYHHLVEDVGIVLGQCFYEALGNKKGIARFGYALIPMDEALAEVAVDISGRPFLHYDVSLDTESLINFNTDLTYEFLYAFAMNAKLTLHVIKKHGKNAHHIIESIFKALAYAIKNAIVIENKIVKSTKGLIE
jgi:imidazoleglycerol-phosphate dehydratase